eukprot:3101099-Amphidinium_carterae.1
MTLVAVSNRRVKWNTAAKHAMVEALALLRNTSSSHKCVSSGRSPHLKVLVSKCDEISLQAFRCMTKQGIETKRRRIAANAMRMMRSEH